MTLHFKPRSQQRNENANEVRVKNLGEGGYHNWGEVVLDEDCRKHTIRQTDMEWWLPIGCYRGSDPKNFLSSITILLAAQ
jgi:hypothetical protein